jgi:hypothetical protein
MSVVTTACVVYSTSCCRIVVSLFFPTRKIEKTIFEILDRMARNVKYLPLLRFLSFIF